MKSVHQFIRKTILAWIDFFYKPFKKYMPLQTFRYAACGGANTVLDISLFSISYNFILKHHDVVFNSVTITAPIAALFMALCVSLPTGFYLNRYVVFQQTGLKGHSQLMRYIFVTGVCIFLNYGFLKFFVEVLGFYPTIAKIVTTTLVIVFSYTSQTYFFFKEKKEDGPGTLS
jgi:putative flippase GtrA